MKQTKSVIQILLAGTCWGMIGIFSKPLAQVGFSAIQITLMRCLIAAIGFIGILFWQKRALFSIDPKDIWMFFGTGICSIVFFNICYFVTIENATLSLASILLYTAPYFVILLSAIFFHEKITLQKIIALVIAFGGCILVTGFQGKDVKTISILTGLGAGFGYALYSIFGNFALKKYHPLTVTVYTFIVAAIGLFPFSQVGGLVTILQQNHSAIPISIALGLCSTLIPFVLYTNGLQFIETGKASVLAFSEPLVATLVGVFVFHETLNIKNFLGILLIFVSIFIINGRGRSLE